MKTILLLLLAATANASTVIKNDQVINVSVSSSPASGYNQVLDLGAADSASFEMNFTCAKGSVTILASNLNSSGFVSLNVAGSSLTVSGTALSTLSNQLYAIPSPAYRYYEFNVTNSSASTGVTVAACSLNVTECIKSLTVTSN